MRNRENRIALDDEEKAAPMTPEEEAAVSTDAVVKSGFLRKRSRYLRTWKRGFFRLYKERLSYYGDQYDKAARREIELYTLCRVSVESSTVLRLTWAAGHGSFQLRADTMAEAFDWARLLTIAIASQSEHEKKMKIATANINIEQEALKKEDHAEDSHQIHQATITPTRLPRPSTSLPATPLDAHNHMHDDDFFQERDFSIATTTEAIDAFDIPQRWIIAPQQIEIDDDPFDDDINEICDPADFDDDDDAPQSTSSLNFNTPMTYSILQPPPSRSAMARRYEQLGTLPASELDNSSLESSSHSETDDEVTATVRKKKVLANSPTASINGDDSCQHTGLSVVQTCFMSLLLCNASVADCACPQML